MCCVFQLEHVSVKLRGVTNQSKLHRRVIQEQGDDLRDSFLVKWTYYLHLFNIVVYRNMQICSTSV